MEQKQPTLQDVRNAMNESIALMNRATANAQAAFDMLYNSMVIADAQAKAKQEAKSEEKKTE